MLPRLSGMCTQGGDARRRKAIAPMACRGSARRAHLHQLRLAGVRLHRLHQLLHAALALCKLGAARLSAISHLTCRPAQRVRVAVSCMVDAQRRCCKRGEQRSARAPHDSPDGRGKGSGSRHAPSAHFSRSSWVPLSGAAVRVCGRLLTLMPRSANARDDNTKNATNSSSAGDSRGIKTGDML